MIDCDIVVDVLLLDQCCCVLIGQFWIWFLVKLGDSKCRALVGRGIVVQFSGSYRLLNVIWLERVIKAVDGFVCRIMLK
jgi:hypothetical protein